MKSIHQLPTRKNGATHQYYDPEREIYVSLGYHDINGRRARKGACDYDLMVHEETEMIIPRDSSEAWEDFITGKSYFKIDPELYEEALRDVHGDPNHALSARAKKYIRKHDYDDEYNIENPHTSEKTKKRSKSTRSSASKSSHSSLNKNNKTTEDSDDKPEEIDPKNIDPRMDDSDLAVWMQLKIIGFNLDDLRDYHLVREAYEELPQLLEDINTSKEALDLINRNDNISITKAQERHIKKAEKIQREDPHKIEECINKSDSVLEAVNMIASGEIDYESSKDNDTSNNQDAKSLSDEQSDTDSPTTDSSELSAFEEFN